MAQKASRGSVDLFTVLFFKNKRIQEEARVTRVMDNGFVVLIPKYVYSNFTCSFSSKKPHLLPSKIATESRDSSQSPKN